MKQSLLFYRESFAALLASFHQPHPDWFWCPRFHQAKENPPKRAFDFHTEMTQYPREGYMESTHWNSYHLRSLLEAKMDCFKQLGEKVMSRTLEWQVTEINIQASILNRFTQLGTPQTAAVA